MSKIKPVMLAILDGWGWREDAADNAVLQASTPVFDKLWQEKPHAFMYTSGMNVGLPDGQMGNSEVGHLNIGAGRVVMQDLPRISQAAQDGTLAKNKVLQDMISTLKTSGGAAHLIGLVSPGGVHAHQDHAVALAKAFSEAGIQSLIHVITDGRDTPPQSAATFVADFEAALPQGASIATVNGRYYAMDRDKRWDRVEKAFNTMVDAKGERFADASAAIKASYEAKVFDEFIIPVVIGDYAGMKDGDGLLCFNFRADRAREILTGMVDDAFDGFAVPRRPKLAFAAGMSFYSDALNPFLKTLFPPQSIKNGLGEVVAAAGLKQIRMAETEKYPHVTYFFNGGEEKQYEGEDRCLVPSPKVATYDLQPEMSAGELTERAVEAISSNQYDLIVLNFANPDMVGHTGDIEAAKKAVQTVDTGLGRIVEAINAAGGAILVTADHGNCELMRDPDNGGPHTAHTTNPVPVIIAGAGDIKMHDGRLCDIAPTLLALMDVAQPAEMTGESLID